LIRSIPRQASAGDDRGSSSPSRQPVRPVAISVPPTSTNRSIVAAVVVDWLVVRQDHGGVPTEDRAARAVDQERVEQDVALGQHPEPPAELLG
jgi:hypothetical protein